MWTKHSGFYFILFYSPSAVKAVVGERVVGEVACEETLT